MKDNDTYVPIECGLHSEYELAIMHNKKCEISWTTSKGTIQTEIAYPKDVISKDKQEFLIIKLSSNEIQEIRLDKILQLKHKD